MNTLFHFFETASFSLFFILIFLIGVTPVWADTYTISIPFGAYNPELNTPAEVWFDPPLLSIKTGDTITWLNEDKESHVVTSGKGAGRFGWMSKNFGTPDGHFASERFMPGESWSFTFEEPGSFEYYCSIHPWMEGIVLVQQTIPDFPQDKTGNILEFPLLQYTPDRMVEVNLTWEPHVIKTHDKIKFIFQFYDPQTNSNLAKMGYEFVLIQNGKELYRDSGINQIGGDFRNFAFDESGPVIIRFEGIQRAAGLAEESTSVGGDIINKAQRSVEFSTIVYENPDKVYHEEFHIKPAQRLEFYYELAIAIILIPAGLFIAILFWMKKKPKSYSKSTPI